MYNDLNNPPRNYLFSKQLNLSDFGLEKQFIKRAKRLLKSNEINSNFNKLVKFIEKTYYYANVSNFDFAIDSTFAFTRPTISSGAVDTQEGTQLYFRKYNKYDEW